MSNVNWVDGAEFYAGGAQCKLVNGRLYFYNEGICRWCVSDFDLARLKGLEDYQINPNISEIGAASDHKKTANQYLNDCIQVQKQRGEQYNSKGTGERSFAAAATAYNAITGHNLKGSDVCLLLTCVKAVRQYSDPTRVHEDSLLDLVSYASLWAEEINKELK